MNDKDPWPDAEDVAAIEQALSSLARILASALTGAVPEDPMEESSGGESDDPFTADEDTDECHPETDR